MESPRLVEALELDDDDPLGPPVALEIFQLTATHDELAAVLGERRGNELPVFLVADRILDVYRGDQVSGHDGTSDVLKMGDAILSANARSRRCLRGALPEDQRDRSQRATDGDAGQDITGIVQ